MAGTREGGLKAAATNYKRHGADFYREIGARGGRNGHTGGFAANPELARIAGAKGGRKSRRGPARKEFQYSVIFPFGYFFTHLLCLSFRQMQPQQFD